MSSNTNNSGRHHKMSETFIPELMELDSYWQKAVEDAICDTLKGEKRLYYALRNRKKINQKLEKLGLRAVHSKFSISGVSPARSDTPHDYRNLSPSASESSMDDELEKSQSKTFHRAETPPEKGFKSPERTLLGNGSLEKMKKSQSSFNYEPMGMQRSMECQSDDELYEERRKEVYWLHKKADNEFEKSDLGSESQSRSNSDRKNSFNSLPDEKETFDLSNLTKVKKKSDLDRRLILALAKRDILKEQLKTTSSDNSNCELEIFGSAVNVVDKKKDGIRLLPPFVRFYLEVYRELCRKCSVKRITEEATNRWRGMTKSQKSAFSRMRSKK